MNSFIERPDIRKLTKKQTDITIYPASEEQAYLWADIFLESLKKCKWMSNYLKSRNITRFDVALSLLEDITSKILLLISMMNLQVLLEFMIIGLQEQ